MDYKQRLAAAVGDRTSQSGYERYSGIYFFLSLDLVNSTAYKADHQDWKFYTRMFYDNAREFWTKHRLNFVPQVWKYAGDEVLFYSRVRSVVHLQAAVSASHYAVRALSDTVQTWTRNARTRMYVKGTCWAAHASYTHPSSIDELPTPDARDPSQRNLVFEPTPEGTRATPALDFLGPEIDAGFRISAGSMRSELIVAAEVAQVIWAKGAGEIADRFRVVEFRSLKGVWNGRHYPLIWYRTDWSREALDNDHDYDGRFRSDTLAKAYSSTQESMKQLGDILRHVERTWLEDLPPDSVDEPDEADENDSALIATPTLQVHCVAVCISATGKVLLGKRKATKSVYPNYWECGCAQLRDCESFHEAMIRDYHADFGIALSFDGLAGEGVIGTYSFTKSNKRIPGVIFAAKVADEPSLSCAKHAEVKWFDPSAVSTMLEELLVPGLQNHVRLALALVNARPGSALQQQLARREE